MNNEKQKRTVHNKKRKADWSHTWNQKKKIVKWVSRFSSATPLSGTPSPFFFPQIRKSSTCSPVPAPYNRLRVALSPPSHFQPPSGGSRKQKRRRKKKNKNKNPPMPQGVYNPVYLFIYFDTLLLMCFWNKNKIKIDSHFYIK